MYIYRHSAVDTFYTISFFLKLKNVTYFFFNYKKVVCSSNYNLMDCIEDAINAFAAIVEVTKFSNKKLIIPD